MCCGVVSPSCPCSPLPCPDSLRLPGSSSTFPSNAFNFEAFAGFCESSSSASMSSESVTRRGVDEAEGSRRRPSFAVPDDTFDLVLREKRENVLC